MSYARYSEIGGPDGLLARREPFKGKSMSARRDSRGTYIVRSYYTDIAWARGEHVHVSERYWSATTSRHQHLCRAWLVSESEARAASARAAARRARARRRSAQRTSARLEAFLPDVRLIGPDAGEALRRMVYAPDPRRSTSRRWHDAATERPATR
jgi:hypothetical protein